MSKGKEFREIYEKVTQFNAKDTAKLYFDKILIELESYAREGRFYEMSISRTEYPALYSNRYVKEELEPLLRAEDIQIYFMDMRGCYGVSF